MIRPAGRRALQIKRPFICTALATSDPLSTEIAERQAQVFYMDVVRIEFKRYFRTLQKTIALNSCAGPSI